MDMLHVRLGDGLLALRDEARAAGLNHFVESLSGLNAIDLVEGVFGERGDIEVLSCSFGGSGRGEQSGATLHGPCEQDLRGGLSNLCSDGQDYRVFEGTGPHSMTQG